MNSAAITIVRGAHRSCFTTIANDLLQNKLGLSCQARAVLFDLLSRPENWRVVIENLSKVHRIGRDQVYKALGELRDCGLARLETLRDPKTGRVAGKRWIISEEPDPLPENQEVGDAADFLKEPKIGETRNSEIQDAYKRKIDKQNTDSPTKLAAPPQGSPAGGSLLADEDEASRPRPAGDAWSRFKAAWTFGLGESESAARKAFDQLSAGDREHAIAGAAAFQAAMAGRTHPPHASTYLAERKWTAAREAPRPEPAAATTTSAKGAASSVIQRPDGTWWLRDGSPQLARWRDWERKTLGKPKPGFIRPAEWPPGLSTRAEGLRTVPMPEARAG